LQAKAIRSCVQIYDSYMTDHLLTASEFPDSMTPNSNKCWRAFGVSIQAAKLFHDAQKRGDRAEERVSNAPASPRRKT
jgi:hypothetical protein